MSNVEYQTIIKFFTLKGLKEVYNEFPPAYRTVAKWLAGFKDDPTHDVEETPRNSRPSTTTTDENINPLLPNVLRCGQL